MTRILGWIAIVLALLAFAAIFTSPWLTRQKYHYKFREFLADEPISEMAEAEINATRPSLIIAVIHQAACLVAGIGLLKKKPWARPLWLTLCWIGLGIVLFGVIWSGLPDLAALGSVAIRGFLLVWSIRVLSSPGARQDFAPSNAG
jgi:hypothetical protein